MHCRKHVDMLTGLSGLASDYQRTIGVTAMGTGQQDSANNVRTAGKIRSIQAAPYWQVLAPDGRPILSVERYLHDFWARGMSTSSVESYGRDLLRWFRFLWGFDKEWNKAGRDDVRAFVISLREASKRLTQSESVTARRQRCFWQAVPN